MTPLEQEIKEGENILAGYSEALEKMRALEEKKDDKAMLHFLVEIFRADYEGKCLSVATRLARLKKDQVFEFERRSAEANMNIEKILTRTKEYVGKEPKSVTSKMEALYLEYKPFMEQGRKNEIFFELKGHIDFLKNTYQDK